MRNKLVITLTTVHGSRQYTLNQVAKFVLPVFLLLSAISFFVSNALLVVKTDDLADLEEDHQELSESFDLLVGTQQLYHDELAQLSTSLSSLKVERDQLHEENIRIGELNASLDNSLYGLENLLGVEHAGELSVERAEELTIEANKRLFFLHTVPNGVPIQAKRISGSFGKRFHPVRKKKVMHYGIDFKADRGTPVYATADGVVEFGGYNKSSGFGKLIILQHNFGFKTYFAHLDAVKVKVGEFVSKGQLIGLSGNTGLSTGPHLHYEIRHLFTAIDPEPFLSWDITNFDSLFTKVKGVKWASLKEMYPLNQQHGLPSQ
ncbi:M23 family metallopeptidase [Neptuniibacter sp.]|uniref:M23 family metallopeptidase n=1 Tax=Neptuniibacter sp. TaxID=1962643 RepID=UPI00260D3A2B|nr:M23 family metallopeptidase [Neptuniibacter sp.]MCP4595725.1 peptidoglycan DD-metalloendopeptidase family protein [Neptuniibacter sp.]